MFGYLADGSDTTDHIRPFSQIILLVLNFKYCCVKIELILEMKIGVDQ